MAEPTRLAEQMVLCHFIVSDDIERSRRFYTDVLGGRLAFSNGDLTYVELAVPSSSSMAAAARPTTSQR